MKINDFIAYFDLQSHKRGLPKLESRQPGDRHTALTVFPQYFALILGIFIQPYFENYRISGSWQLVIDSAWSWIAFAVIVGLVIFPSVYRSAFNPDQPRFVQFCVIFASGMGWKSLLDTAFKLSSSIA